MGKLRHCLGCISTYMLDLLRTYEPLPLLLIIRVLQSLFSALDCLILKPLFDSSILRGSGQEEDEAYREGRTAQLCHFWTFAPHRAFLGFAQLQLKDMLLTHQKYVKPQWVLGKNHVKLWECDGDIVYFSVTPSHIDLFDVRKNPFSVMNMSSLSTRILLMSMTDFHRLAREIGDPQCKLTVVHMTARCGSTLLCQMMNELPDTRVIAEPRIFYRLGYDLTQQQPCRSVLEVREMLQSIIRILCRPSSGQTLKHVFIKLAFFEAPYIHLLPHLFPQVKLIFNTRMPLPSLKSFGKVFRFSVTYPPSIRILDTFWPNKMSRTFLIPIPADFVFPAPLGNPDLSKRCSLLFNSQPTPYEAGGHWEGFSALFYLCSMECFLAHKQCYQMVLLYEDLCNKPEDTLKELFTTIDEPIEHLDLALRAMERHSQNGIGGALGEEVGYVAPHSTWKSIDHLARDMGSKISMDMDEGSFRRLVTLSN